MSNKSDTEATYILTALFLEASGWNQVLPLVADTDWNNFSLFSLKGLNSGSWNKKKKMAPDFGFVGSSESILVEHMHDFGLTN